MCVSFADLGQTSRTISGVDRVREPGPSRTPSPSVGSFQDMAARRPRQDDSVLHKVTPPTLPLPHSQGGTPRAIRYPTVPQIQVHVVPNDSIIPETEADATSDELQFLERCTKSRNDQQWEEKLNCGDEEVNGRLKRKKGHQRIQPQERDVRNTLQEGDVSQKRRGGGSSSRRGTQSQAAVDFEDDTADFSTDEDDEGEESEDDFDETQDVSLLGIRGKESQIDRFLRETETGADRKNSSMKRGKKLQVANKRCISTRTRSAQRGRP